MNSAHVVEPELLVDDQDLLRSGIRIILESEPGIVVVGEARDGHDALERIKQVSPDVVCLDVQMPGMDGLTATRLITALEHPPAVLVLTTFDRDDYLFEALEGGGSGFLLKNSTPEQLVDAVQVVARGDALLSPDVTRRVIERFAQRGAGARAAGVNAGDSDAAAAATAADAARAAAAIAELTARERDVLDFVARSRKCCRSSACAIASRPSSSPTSTASRCRGRSFPRALSSPPRGGGGVRMASAYPPGGGCTRRQGSLAWRRRKGQPCCR
jgi:DNA-binding NarL/FixJ family response regulator